MLAGNTHHPLGHVGTWQVRALALAMVMWLLELHAAEDMTSFRNEVMPVLSKAGCNAGTCHGNKNGKGGFKLSLRGENATDDYLALTHDMFGRRLNVLQPESSLVLLKATTRVGHEGGQRFTRSSPEYETLRRWITSGAHDDSKTAPRLTRLEVSPKEELLQAPDNSVQFRVMAYFSDHTSRDVTSDAVYDVVGPAKISASGLGTVTAAGEATVLVRFLQCQEASRITFVPARSGFVWADPPAYNFVDEHIFHRLERVRLNPAELCTDNVYVRRAYLDLIGFLPTAEEARAFVTDVRTDKRARLIDQLLGRSEFADFWALKWADLLRVEAHSLDQKGVQNFHQWIRAGLLTNKPMDQFVRELIGGRGSTYDQPAANYYRPNRQPVARAKAAAQIFLGTRLQCAECHNHPSDRWTQDDYYDWAAVFARVRYKVIENKREIGSDEHEWNGEQIVYVAGSGSVQNPRTGQAARPRFLGESQAFDPNAADELLTLADWLTSPTNRLFARVQVNRIWYHLMGRGLIDPPDDVRSTNPASHPELLERLADQFIEHGFDLRYLIRTIMQSRTYQLSSSPISEEVEASLFAYVLPRRLGAEQLLDCQSRTADVPLRFSGYPVGTRASQLPGVRPESKGKRRANAVDQFLETFGKPPRLLTTDTERSCECDLGQVLQLVSGATLNALVTDGKNRITRLLNESQSDEAILDELYWTALSRPASEEETRLLLAQTKSAVDRRARWEDILWGLLNCKEFIFRQ